MESDQYIQVDSSTISNNYYLYIFHFKSIYPLSCKSVKNPPVAAEHHHLNGFAPKRLEIWNQNLRDDS